VIGIGASIITVATGFTTALLQGAVTTITEAGTANWAFAFGLFYGGLVQLLAGMVRWSGTDIYYPFA
jgi:succinate-acetate transporter protein